MKEPTHLDRLRAILDEAGVEHKIKFGYTLEDEQGQDIVYTKGAQALRIKQGYEKVEGYFDFYCEFYFDEDGNMTGAGCWE